MSLEVSRPRLPAVTSLRFFAAFHVALFHMKEMRVLTHPEWLRAFAGIGYTGVSFFFVLSGFILVYTYWGRDISLGNFWQTRFARIYPAYLFSLVLTFPFFYLARSKCTCRSSHLPSITSRSRRCWCCRCCRHGCLRRHSPGTRWRGAFRSRRSSTVSFHSRSSASERSRARCCGQSFRHAGLPVWQFRSGIWRCYRPALLT